MAKRYNDGAYAGEGAARTQQSQDSGMIRENRGAVANLPQEVMYKPWPSDNNYLNANLNDDISGIDRMKNEDVNGAKRHLQANKW